METKKVCSKLLVGVQSIFYAMTLLERLAENIEEGISDVEFLESESSFSCDAFYAQIDALIILLAFYLDEEEDHELARYLRVRHGIEFEGESVIDASGGAKRAKNADEELIAVPKSKFFDVFALVILYGHPNVFYLRGPDLTPSCEEMRTFFGRRAFKPCMLGFMKLITQKRLCAYERYKNEHSEISVNVWL